MVWFEPGQAEYDRVGLDFSTGGRGIVTIVINTVALPFGRCIQWWFDILADSSIGIQWYSEYYRIRQ